MHSPDILILDDPTSSLDNIVTDKIMKIIRHSPHWESKTFVIGTNNDKLVEYADRVIHIERGTVLFNGSYDDFKRNSPYGRTIEERVSARDRSTSCIQV